MFWNKNKQPSPEGMHIAERCRIEAEELYRSGKYHCAEAVLETMRVHFAPDTPESVVASVSGFGGGSGSGCICGAVAAGTVALGMILQEKKATAHMTKELHSWFKDKYGATCCKVIRARNDKGLCPELTGEVAEKVAEMLDRSRQNA